MRKMIIDVGRVADSHIQSEIIKNGLNKQEFLKVYDTMPLDVLHYLRKWENLTEEEAAAYRKRCNIDELSEFVWDSTSVTNSRAVSDSSSISNSSFIWLSKLITDSENVYNSTDVEDSTDIYYSEGILKSNRIVKSKNIKYSDMILMSNTVEWSNNISYSSDVDYSKFVYKSNNVYECFFSGFLRNCNHCICCNNLVNKEFYVFNESVTPVEFMRVEEELNSKLALETSTFISVNKQIHRENRVKYDFRLDDIFDGLSEDFYGYIGTILNYNEADFLSIFFRR